MKNIFFRTTSLWASVLYMALGLVLTFWPGMSGTVFCWGIAAALILYAAHSFWYFIKARNLGFTAGGTLVIGILCLAFGIFCFSRPYVVLSFLPIALGIMLLVDGIGDTIRVSLTADPVEEVRAGIAILKAAGLRREGVRFVSCPTCGRTQIDLIALAQEVEQRLQGLEREITVAVMGCVVNGPGEAHEADYGIAGGKDCGLLFRRGEILGKYPADKLADALVDLILSEK